MDNKYPNKAPDAVLAELPEAEYMTVTGRDAYSASQMLAFRAKGIREALNTRAEGIARVEGGEAVAWHYRYRKTHDGAWSNWAIASVVGPERQAKAPGFEYEFRPLYARPPTAKGDTGAAGVGLPEAMEALDIVRQALNDWTCDYADDFFDNETVAGARKRINEFGPLYYISKANEAQNTVRIALSAAPLPQAGWLPIESAPRDGKIDIWTESGIRYTGCYWDSICGEYRTTGNANILTCLPLRICKFWMAIPAPPQAQGTGPAGED